MSKLEKKSFLMCIQDHGTLVISIVIAITLVLGFFALSLNLNGDYGSLMPYGEDPATYVAGNKDAVDTDLDLLPASRETRVYPPAQPSAYSGTVSIPDRIADQTVPDYSRSTNYIVMLESDNLFDPAVLDVVDACIWNLENQPELSKSSSILDFVTIEKKGTRIATVPMSVHQDGTPWTQEEADQLYQRVVNDDIVKNYLVSEDLDAIIFTFDISGVGQGRLNELEQYLQPLSEVGVTYYINGGSVINNKVMHYLSRDLITLLSLCFLVILIVYYLSFRAKRSMFIPFSLSVIGIIWTFGTMSLMGFSLTIVNIVTPCMVLTLGSSYSIHMLSEYYESARKGLDPKAAAKATGAIIKTIVLAAMTTISGFLSLLVSETPALKEFGLTVAIGVVYCAILSFTYLPAVLSKVAPPKAKQMDVYETGLLTRVIKKLSSWIIRHWILCLCFVLVIFGGFMLTKDRISVDTNYMSYFPESDPFGQESKHFAKKMGGVNPYHIEIKAPAGAEKGYFLQPENLSKVYNYQQSVLIGCDDVLQAISFPTYVSFLNRVYSGESGIPESQAMINMLNRLIIMLKNQIGPGLGDFINEDGTAMTLILQHYDSEAQDLMTVGSMQRVEDALLDNLWRLPNDTTVTIKGDPAVTLLFSVRLLNDQNISTILSLLLVLLIASIAFKSLKYGLITLVPVAFGVMANYIWMYILNIPFDMVTVSFTSVAVGAGVDDALHFLLRYTGKLKRNTGKTVPMLLETTINETGRPIVLTSVSIIAGMMMLVFASYTPIRYFGILMSIALLNTMLATIFIMPPVVILWDTIQSKLFHKHAKKH